MNEKIEKVINENESLIYYISRKYSNYYSLEDLYQVGVIGLIKAYRKYDNSSNTKFSSYAYKYILGEIVTFIKKDRNIQVSDEIFSIYKKYKKIKDILFNKNGKEPSISKISEFMEIDINKLVYVIESVAFTKSIVDDENYFDSIDNRDEIDNRILLENGINSLNSIQKKLINCRYYQGYNQEETASILGISQSSVSREEKLVLSIIKNSIS